MPVHIYIYPDGTSEARRVIHPNSLEAGSPDRVNRADIVVEYDEYSAHTKVLKHRYKELRSDVETEGTG